MFINNKILTIKTTRKHGPVKSRVNAFKIISEVKLFLSRPVKFKKNSRVCGQK